MKNTITAAALSLATTFAANAQEELYVTPECAVDAMAKAFGTPLEYEIVDGNVGGFKLYEFEEDGSTGSVSATVILSPTGRVESLNTQASLQNVDAGKETAASTTIDYTDGELEMRTTAYGGNIMSGLTQSIAKSLDAQLRECAAPQLISTNPPKTRAQIRLKPQKSFVFKALHGL